MSFINVRNKKGTADKTPPDEYTSWLDFWEKNKGKKATECEATLCYKKATVGGHVIKDGKGGKEYILPLCHFHNGQSEDEIFNAWENDLIPVK
ncbi:MAG: hypothetical protein AB7O73_01405 [Bacteroidia bacterium]